MNFCFCKRFDNNIKQKKINEYFNFFPKVCDLSYEQEKMDNEYLLLSNFQISPPVLPPQFSPIIQ